MDAYYRPKLKLKMSLLERILNVIGLIFLLGSFIYLLVVWPTIPTEVPDQYNGDDMVNQRESKWEMLVPLFVGLTMWVSMTILERYPHLYNYANVTEKNVRAQYLNGRMMINVLKNMIVIFLACLNWQSVQAALWNEVFLGKWFAPIFLLLIFAITIYFIRKTLVYQQK